MTSDANCKKASPLDLLKLAGVGPEAMAALREAILLIKFGHADSPRGEMAVTACEFLAHDLPDLWSQNAPQEEKRDA